MQLNDPLQNESTSTVGGSPPAAPRSRFTSLALSQGGMAFLKRSLAQNQRRRRVYRGSQLRVCIDGHECWQFDSRIGVAGPFSIPLSAAYLEVFGDDDDGVLLLAVLPLPEPAVVESDGAQHLFVTLEGGQTVAFEIALSNGSDAKVSEFCIQIAYLESAAVHARDAEPHAVEARRLLPRPETSTLWNLWLPLGPTILALLIA
jgi:hypothetical protein